MSIFIWQGCTQEPDSSQRFTRLSPEQSQIRFANVLKESDTLNYFSYPYIYMGGGLAVGDINNDNLLDIYFSGNMVGNQLYLNQGNLQFEDISMKAQVQGDHRWYTGTTMVDINADGFMDIYVCVSGPGEQSHNQLFINHGDLTFSEKAAEYGLADNGKSIQATFFDYDLDGDLDLFLANYPLTRFSTSQRLYRVYMQEKDPQKSDKLYRNNGDNTFSDVTQESGILNFGLAVSAAISDFNHDGWPDIYVSNDFSTPDYLYINQGDGTFSEKLKEASRQTAFYGMGTDAADFNNDGLTDLFQVDMAARDNRRSKANMASMNPTTFWNTVNNGFHYQYMYNALQLNRGILDSLPQFSNIAWQAQVAMSDWSWAPLFIDLDNDGWKDLFISNGTRREVNNRDFFKNLDLDVHKISGAQQLALSQEIPSEPIDNFVYRNDAALGFVPSNDDWGLHFVGFSNGAAYADLDNDGDMELILNNIDSAAVLFKNNSREIAPEDHYLRVKLIGQAPNSQAIGASLTVYYQDQLQYLYNNPSRGFQSSVDPILHFGLGAVEQIDSLVVRWPGQHTSVLLKPGIDQLLTIEETPNTSPARQDFPPKPAQWQLQASLAPQFIHQENYFDDFAYQVLLPHQLSSFGPALAVGDVNGDGLDDFYIGNASGASPRLYLQESDGSFSQSGTLGDSDPTFEDLDAAFLDADQDGDLDLYVVSGGNEFPEGSRFYQDRFYRNDKGSLVYAPDALPKITGSGSCVRPFDYDQDGDLDLFVGGRLSPRNYPFPGESYLLRNDSESGQVRFKDVSELSAPGLKDLGMVTDALWTDVDGDQVGDLIIVGEWMSPQVFLNGQGKLTNKSDDFGFAENTAWWFSIEQADLDGDGDQDLLMGNLGQNYKYQAQAETPFDFYVHDFDKNRKKDLVLSFRQEGKQFPVRGRECSAQQIPNIKLAFKNYESFASSSLKDIYGEKALDEAIHYQVKDFSSRVFLKQGHGKYTEIALPPLAQISPINDILVDDFDADGHIDLMVAGNLYVSEVETPRADAGLGLFLKGDGTGNFTPISPKSSGLLIPYDTKALKPIRLGTKKGFLVANNAGPLLLYRQNKAVN